jgi:hypothetical protein
MTNLKEMSFITGVNAKGQYKCDQKQQKAIKQSAIDQLGEKLGFEKVKSGLRFAIGIDKDTKETVYIMCDIHTSTTTDFLNKEDKEVEEKISIDLDLG